MATAKKAAKSPAKSAKRANGKAADNKKWAGVALPPGFNAIQGGEFGQKWDYEAHPVLEGTAGEIRTVEQGTGKKKRDVRVVDVKAKDGTTYAVWESAALAGWFDELAESKAGAQVAIAFKGYRQTGKGKNPMKDFAAGIKAGAAKKAAKGKGARA